MESLTGMNIYAVRLSPSRLALVKQCIEDSTRLTSNSMLGTCHHACAQTFSAGDGRHKKPAIWIS